MQERRQALNDTGLHQTGAECGRIGLRLRDGVSRCQTTALKAAMLTSMGKKGGVMGGKKHNAGWIR